MSKPSRNESFLLVSLFLTAVTSGPVSAATLHVPNDYATLQAAVDAAQSGDQIIVKKGKHPGNVTIAGKSDLEIRAAGKAVLVAGDAAYAVWIAPTAPRTTLRGFRIEGGMGGVYVASDESALLDLDVRPTLSSGVVVAGNDVLVADCVLRGANLRVTGEGAVIADTTVRNVAASVPGIDVAEVERLSIVDCVVRDVEGVAVAVETAFPNDPNPGVLVAGCVLKNAMEGIDVEDSSLWGNAVVSLLENKMQKMEANGIKVSSELPASCEVSGNKVTKVGGYGVLTMTSNQSIHANKVKKPGQDGIYVLSFGQEVVGNRVEKAGGYGFVLQCSDSMVMGNVAKKSASGGADTAGMGSGNTLVGNSFD